MQLVDIGLNLTHQRFDKDREAVLSRARAARVQQMILTGTNVIASKQAANYAARYALDPAHRNILFSTAGVHPHDAGDVSEDYLIRLRELLERPEVVAVGECGLDYNRHITPRDVQQKIFHEQLELAAEVQKPLFLHCREAHEDLIKHLSSIAHLPPVIVHCFTGTQTELEDYIAAGYFIGVTGWICDERRGTELQALVKHIPLDRIMLETDAPYLTPRDFPPDMDPAPKSGRNEPCFLPHILQVVAGHMKVSVEALAEASTTNARLFFNLPTGKNG
jgi:TatD DNase family protein